MGKIGAAKSVAKGVKKGWGKESYDSAVTKVNKIVRKTNKKRISTLQPGTYSAKSTTKAEKAGRGARKVAGKAVKGGVVVGGAEAANRSQQHYRGVTPAKAHQMADWSGRAMSGKPPGRKPLGEREAARKAGKKYPRGGFFATTNSDVKRHKAGTKTKKN